MAEKDWNWKKLANLFKFLKLLNQNVDMYSFSWKNSYDVVLLVYKALFRNVESLEWNTQMPFFSQLRPTSKKTTVTIPFKGCFTREASRITNITSEAWSLLAFFLSEQRTMIRKLPFIFLAHRSYFAFLRCCFEKKKKAALETVMISLFLFSHALRRPATPLRCRRNFGTP